MLQQAKRENITHLFSNSTFILTFTIKLTFSYKTSYIGVHVEMTKGEQKQGAEA